MSAASSLSAILALAACGGGGGSVNAPDAASVVSAASAASGTDTSSQAAAISLPPKTDGSASRQAPAVTVTVPPVVFNASASGRAGNVISLQGENFGTAPQVWLDAVGSTPKTALAIANQVGTGWLAVTIPATATGPLQLRVVNGTASSTPVLLNAATPHHLDAMQIVPGGAFRVFGRNLKLAGSTPTITVDGLPASIDVAASDEHMLVATAPAALRPNAAAAILVDNGNGLGATQLSRKITAVASAGADPFGTGVGWAGGFAKLLSNVVNPANDSRLSARMACDGRTDDTPVLKEAVNLVQSLGGGIVNLPAGTCHLANFVSVGSNVVIQGAGKDRTVLLHDTQHPIYALNGDLIAIRNLTFTYTGNDRIGLFVRNSTRVLIQNIKMNLSAQSEAQFTANTNIAVVGSDFIKAVAPNTSTAMSVMNNAGMSFTGNNVYFLNGVGTEFDGVHDAYIAQNIWTRDASRQTDPAVTHSTTFNFSHNVALVGNTLRAINGTVDMGNNDGELILSEGGGGIRTETLGTVMSSTSNTFTDSKAVISPNAYPDAGPLAENYGVAIVAGTGAGQSRHITKALNGSFTVDRAWDVQPDTTSRYVMMRWSLERSVIKNNTLNNSTRGIMLYFGAFRDVDVVGNSMVESGGIFLVASQKVSDQLFTPICNIRIEGNVVKNTTRSYISNISVHFANIDGNAYGMPISGVEVRNNELIANTPNLTRNDMGPIGMEGYLNQMNIESSTFVTSAMPRLLGSIFQNNACANCNAAFRLGTGAAGTVLYGNTVVNTTTLWSNSITSISADAATLTAVK